MSEQSYSLIFSISLGNENVGGLSLHTAKRLMDQYPGMRQAGSLPFSAGTKQNSAHGSSHTRADGGDIRFDELHRVVDAKASTDHTTGRVKIERDVRLVIN